MVRQGVSDPTVLYRRRGSENSTGAGPYVSKAQFHNHFGIRRTFRDEFLALEVPRADFDLC